MLSINTNLSSLITQSSLKTSTLKLNEAIERMTTGAKINHAKDNAANYSICTNMSTKISAYQVAEDNAMMGLDLLNTATGSLDLISDKLARLRALAEQAANGTYGDESKQAINSEANAIVDEIQRVYKTTEYNGQKLFQNTSGGEFIQKVIRRDTSAMTTLASVDSSVRLTSGTYSISTPEELKKLSDMTNSGKIGKDTEFVLAANIDLSKYSSGEGWVPIGIYNKDDGSGEKYFMAHFDGNGYTISNLYVNQTDRTKNMGGGLFYGNGCTIENLGVVDVNVKARTASAVGSFCEHSTIRNCYSTGLVQGWGHNIAGITHHATTCTVESCYSSCTVRALDPESLNVGGITGDVHWGTIKNCYFDGAVYGNDRVGGITGIGESATIENCYNKGSISSSVGKASGIAGYVDDGSITNCYELSKSVLSALFFDHSDRGTTLIKDCYYNEWYDDKNIPVVSYVKNSATYVVENLQSCTDTVPFKASYKMPDEDKPLQIQAGIDSSDSSRITVDTKFLLDRISNLRLIGLSDTNFLEQIDLLQESASSKQTGFGAVQNRLESALESISIQYENLVSSRSTIQDADIADVSSEYIRQQILQQASATLMATANQTPAIALQLL